MASNHHNGNGTGDRKLSGFSKRVRAEQAGDGSAADNGRAGKGSGKMMLGRRGNRWWTALLVDLILLVVLVGLVIGGVFGYRALRNLYAPAWETRDVVFCVEIRDISPDMVKYGQGGRPTMTNNPLWSSDQTDADQLGIVTDVRTVLVTVDGTNTLTLYLTVEAKAYYREGKGYRMGETMLLAGYEGLFRMESLTAQGTIISMHEKSDELTTEAATEPAQTPLETAAPNPEAQG